MPEIVIRGMVAEQLEVVAKQIMPFVQKKGKIGITTSLYALTGRGSLDRLPTGDIEWRQMMAERHPLLDPQTDEN